MVSSLFPGAFFVAAALLGLIPLGQFARVLFRAGAPDPHDREPSPFDWIFPLRGRWRRIFFLCIQFVFIGALVYCGGVLVAIMGLAFLWCIFLAILQMLGFP